MRTIAWALVVGAVLAAAPKPQPASQRTITVSSATELQAALRTPLSDVTIQLAPGNYSLVPESTTLELHECGSDSYLEAPGTVGLKVSGERVRIVASQEGVRLVSNATRVVYFHECNDCAMEGVSVNATAAGENAFGNVGVMYLRKSSVHIRNCVIDGSPSARATYGILVKERSRAMIEYNEITGCTNGVALFEDASATLENNVIAYDGGKELGEAVMAGCNATAVVERNHIRGSTVGIRLMNNASLDCAHNIIEEIRQDGIFAVSPSLGRVRILDNVFFNCGSSGLTIRAEGDQQAVDNLVVSTGQFRAPPSSIVVSGAHADAAVRKNTLYGNNVTDPALDRDVSREAFWRARRPWTRTYRNTAVGVDGRHRFYESTFLTRYGRWTD